jgi:hypothetical protein
MVEHLSNIYVVLCLISSSMYTEITLPFILAPENKMLGISLPKYAQDLHK